MRRTHGMSRTPLYRVWARIKGCTTSPTHQDYKFYGAKGVKVCDEWATSFSAFYEWAISHGYKQGLTIDRIDSCGDYTPNNCRWITIQEQQRNRKAGTKEGCVGKMLSQNLYTSREKIIRVVIPVYSKEKMANGRHRTILTGEKSM